MVSDLCDGEVRRKTQGASDGRKKIQKKKKEATTMCGLVCFQNLAKRTCAHKCIYREDYGRFLMFSCVSLTFSYTRCTATVVVEQKNNNEARARERVRGLGCGACCEKQGL